MAISKRDASDATSMVSVEWLETLFRSRADLVHPFVAEELLLIARQQANRSEDDEVEDPADLNDLFDA